MNPTHSQPTLIPNPTSHTDTYSHTRTDRRTRIVIDGQLSQGAGARSQRAQQHAKRSAHAITLIINSIIIVRTSTLLINPSTMVRAIACATGITSPFRIIILGKTIATAQRVEGQIEQSQQSARGERVRVNGGDAIVVEMQRLEQRQVAERRHVTEWVGWRRGW